MSAIPEPSAWRRRAGWPLATGAFLLLLIGLFWPRLTGAYRPAPEIYRAELGLVMGTSAHLAVAVDGGLTVTPAEAAERAFAAAKRVEKLMSRFDPQSDLSRLNASPAGQWVAVDPDLWEVLANAQRFNRLSGGAFDVTVAPLIEIYRYGNGPAKLPDPEVVAQAKLRVGGAGLELEREGFKARLAKPGMKLDLGAIAKGFGVDAAREALLAVGAKNAVIEIGGEVWIMGEKLPPRPSARQELGSSKPAAPANPTPPKPEANGAGDSVAKAAASPADGGQPWRTGVRHPRKDELLETLEVADRAVATSGDYEKFFEVDGKRYSHIIDPRTGYPVSGGVISATIISPRSCLEADALATAVSVLGEAEGRRLVELFPGVEAILVVQDGDQLREIKFSAPAQPVPPGAE